MTDMETRKKQYGKPEIVFEDFSLTTTIAAGCRNTSALPVHNTCGIKYPGVSEPLFVAGVSGCLADVEDGFGAMCYYNPTDSAKLFNSI